MSEAVQVCSHARNLFLHGLVEEALELTQLTLEKEPDSAALWGLQGQLLQSSGLIEQAIASLETASCLAPLSVEAQLALAECYLRKDLRQSAEAIFRYLAGREELAAEDLGRVARGLAALGRIPKALAVCRLAAKRYPERDEALYGMAYYMGRLNYRPETIIPVIRQALELDPQCALYRISLAGLLDRVEQHAEAYEVLQALTPARAAASACPAMLRRLILIFARFGDQDRARACWLRLRSLLGETNREA